jgi:hypothetical protein
VVTVTGLLKGAACRPEFYAVCTGRRSGPKVQAATFGFEQARCFDQHANRRAIEQRHLRAIHHDIVLAIQDGIGETCREFRGSVAINRAAQLNGVLSHP